MRVTIGRWVAAVLACCALVAIVVPPLPRMAKTTWAGVDSEVMSSSVAALSVAAADLNDAVRDYRVAQGVALWKAHKSGDALQIDASTPSPVADFVRSVAQEEWRRVGEGASASHAAVFVYFDTSTIAGVARPNKRRSVEPRRSADVWYALPEITDGERCLVLVRVRVSALAQLANLRDGSLLGPCAYFAAFGRPGKAVHQWLEATNYRAVRAPDWDRPRAPAVDDVALYTLNPEASRCLTGQPGSCSRVLRRDAAPGVATRVVDGNWSGESIKHRTLLLGEAAPRFLADAVRELGHPRFSRFWTSSAPLDSAFAAAANVSLDAWTIRWLERSYGKPQKVAAVRLHDVLWLVVLLPLVVLVAARRRERVLVERFRLPVASTG